VVGFDNIPESALNSPPLTTIDQSIQLMGAEAVRLLLSLIDEGLTDDAPIGGRASGPLHVTLPTELVIRQSCQPPQGAGPD
jgi:LacI family transcriptional regulator